MKKFISTPEMETLDLELVQLEKNQNNQLVELEEKPNFPIFKQKYLEITYFCTSERKCPTGVSNKEIKVKLF